MANNTALLFGGVAFVSMQPDEGSGRGRGPMSRQEGMT